ncbi:ArsR/SmtB family transcription factor [Gilvimarinus algae]|uniref:ArsR/SmtB family transcription factor n=1 Tax=Gilvimarinus algae TaxID=3058037 RepID=UPI0034A09A38
MKAARTPDLQSTFRALADPTRREILVFLSQHESSIGEVVDQFDVTRGAIKKHLVILEEGGLISIHTRGRERINRLEPSALHSVNSWLQYFEQFWDNNLRNLKTAIEQRTPTNPKRKKQ